MSETMDIEIAAPRPLKTAGTSFAHLDDLFNSAALCRWLKDGTTTYVGVSPVASRFEMSAESLAFMIECLEGQGAAMVYADYVAVRGTTKTLHQLNDAERHVCRDTFDFGPLLVMRRADALRALEGVECRRSAVYALTLGLQRIGALYHTGVPIGTVEDEDGRDSGVKQFDYLRPDDAETQRERERIFTDHLRAIGAAVSPDKRIDAKPRSEFERRASVIIPVRNRVRTIADAIGSALEQRTSFDFNVMVVDNHSDDGTTQLLTKLAAADERIVHIVPRQTTLGIGGCWNEAAASPACGKYAVQLDSDDLYAHPGALQTIVDKFSERPYALVVGSYRLVNFALEEIPPGVVDHREWTDANGANNILRINGMGAPRAFATDWLRKHPMPNVSYGEDYAAVLAATRRYHVGRIFDVLYLCRRWDGNSDAGLPIEAQAAHDAYKDKLRSDEIEARIAMNKKR